MTVWKELEVLVVQELIKDGILAPIPAIINDKTREIIKIPNFAI